MVNEHQFSERRACRLVGLSRDAYRHPPVVSTENQTLTDAIKTIALQRRRVGYRRVHDLLRTAHPGVNHKRVYRLYHAADLAVRKRAKAKRPMGERTPLVAASHVNATWSMDFVSDSLCSGRRLKCLTVADDFSHECVDIAVDFGIGGEYVTRLLDQAARFRGYPQAVRTDNGPEFTSRAFLGWAQRHGIKHIWRADAERLYRELQRQVPRRVPQRALVRDAGASPCRDPGLGAGLQRGAAAFEHRSHATQVLRTPSSAAGCRRRFDFNRRNGDTLHPQGSLAMTGTAKGGRSMESRIANRCLAFRVFCTCQIVSVAQNWYKNPRNARSRITAASASP